MTIFDCKDCGAPTDDIVCDACLRVDREAMKNPRNCGACRWWTADISGYTGVCREANDTERRSMAKNTATTFGCDDWRRRDG